MNPDFNFPAFNSIRIFELPESKGSGILQVILDYPYFTPLFQTFFWDKILFKTFAVDFIQQSNYFTSFSWKYFLNYFTLFSLFLWNVCIIIICREKHGLLHFTCDKQ